MAIKIPRSRISTAGTARRTLMPGSEAGLVYKSFGQLADSVTRISAGLLGEQMKEDQGVWETKAKANFENAEMLRDQALLELRNEENLNPMDQPVALFEIMHDFADDIEAGEKAALEGLHPRSQRILSKSSATRLESLRATPGPLLKAMADSVDKSRLDLINSRALNNYGDSTDPGSQAATDLSYAAGLLDRGLINAGELSAVQTTALNGMRTSYFSRGAEGRMDYFLGAFAEAGSGGVANLPRNIVDRIRGDVLQNREGYIGSTATQMSQSEDGSFTASPTGGIQYNSPDRGDLERGIAVIDALARAGFGEDAATLFASVEMGGRAQDRINKAGRDSARIANANGPSGNLDAVLGETSSRPVDLDKSFSVLPQELLNFNSEALIKISNKYGALLPSLAEALNNRMDEGDPDAWQTASDLMGELGFIPVKALPDGFKFSSKRISEIVNYGNARGNQPPVQAMVNAVAPDGRGTGQRAGGGRTAAADQADIIELISEAVNRNPAIVSMSQAGKDSITNLIVNNYYENNLQTIQAAPANSTRSDAEKIGLAIDESVGQVLNDYPPIKRNGQSFFHQISLPEEQRTDNSGNPADSEAWIYDELFKVLSGGSTTFLDDITEEEFFSDIAPYLHIQPLSTVTMGGKSSTYTVSFFPKDGEYVDSRSGLIKNTQNTQFIFEPQYKDSFRATVGPTPAGQDPLTFDTREEISDAYIESLVPLGDGYFKQGTLGGWFERQGSAATKNVEMISSEMWHGTTAVFSHLSGMVQRSLIGNEPFDEANAKELKTLEKDFARWRNRGLEKTRNRNELAGQVLLISGKVPPALLRNPELVPEFKDILDHNARVLDPSSGASDTITVDGEEIKLQPWALKARSKFAAFWRFQGSGDIALHSPEYQQYVYEMSLHQLHDRLAQRFADDPEEFMKQYPTEIPAGAASRLTPDAMRALVASTPTIQVSQFRADHPTKPGSWIQVPGDPQHGPSEFPLKPLDYNPIDTILELGPGARAFDVPIGDPRVVEKNVEIWLKQNNATGSLMPPPGGYVPPGWHTDVGLIQEVVSENPKEYTNRVASALYGNIGGEAGAEAIFGQFGFIPGAADMTNKKPGWIWKYYTEASRKYDIEWGTHPNEELAKMKITIASLVPGDGASIMALTNRQFFDVLEAGYKIHIVDEERRILMAVGQTLVEELPAIMLEEFDDRSEWSYYRFRESAERGDMGGARVALSKKIKSHRATVLELVAANEKIRKSGKGGDPDIYTDDIKDLTDGIKRLEAAAAMLKDYKGKSTRPWRSGGR